MQTKKGSAIEVIVNTLSGTVVSYILTLTALPWFGLHPTQTDVLGLTIIFTIASLVRGYVVRRIFNKKPRKVEIQCGAITGDKQKEKKAPVDKYNNI